MNFKQTTRISVLILLALWAGCSSTSGDDTAKKQYPAPFEATLEAGSWQVGVGAEPLFAPPGLSMGGYGMRPGPTGGLAGRLGGSRGSYGSLMVKSMAISNGHGLVLFCKIPAVFPTDLMRRRTIQKLAESTGYDFSDALILNATHSHSGPGRFWALPPGFVGYLGLDDFDPAVLDAMVSSIAVAAEKSWRDLKPARIGITEITRYDPENRINSDRRSENDNLYTDLSDPNVYLQEGNYKSKDHRMLLVRVDDPDGTPIAGIIRMGVHGTVLTHEMHAEDVPGAVETASQQLWQVPFVMYLQGTAGDVTPSGGDNDRGSLQRLEAVGVRAAQVALPAWRNIVTEEQGIFAIAHRRKTVNRTTLGYRDNEYGRGDTEGAFYPHQYGAILCGDFGADPEPDGGRPETVMEDGSLGCFDIEDLTGVATEQGREELPIAELSVAVLSAVRIGDWRLVTYPGEAVSQLGSKLLKEAAAKGYNKVSVLGYSQTHLFYLTAKEDWFQGGYEANMNIWGWKLGDWLTGHNLALLDRLDHYGQEPTWDGDYLVPLPRETETHEVEIEQIAAPRWLGLDGWQLSQLDQIQGRWIGGQQWVDRPLVLLVSEDGKTLADSGDFGWRIMAEADPAEIGYASNKRELTYEAGLDVPPGSYRFVVRGLWEADDKELNYEIQSELFQVVAGHNLQVTRVTVGNALNWYTAIRPNPQKYDWLLGNDLPKYQTLGMRMVSDLYGPAQATPVSGETLTLTVQGAAVSNPTQYLLPWDAVCGCFSQSPAPLSAETLVVHDAELVKSGAAWLHSVPVAAAP